MNQCIRIPGCTYLGRGSICRLQDIIREERTDSVLLITDRGVLGSGVVDPVTELLDSMEIKWRVLDSVKAEPGYLEVEEILEEVKDFSCGLVVAAGGGSVMDTAKLYSILKGAGYSVKDLLDGKTQIRKSVKTVMIPTTCGTGAEATCNAIVAVPEENVKKGIVNQSMIPDYVILDPSMIDRLPAKMVAATGIDALAHAVECFTSNKATELSNLYAAESAKLIFHSIREAYDSGENKKARENMMLGAYYGGIAITGSGTTAVHALSYPLGGKYHIPHGISNAILFAHVMRMNREACKEQLAGLYDYVWPGGEVKTSGEKAESVIKEIEDIVSYTEIPVNLEEFGVRKEDLDFLAKSGSQQRRLLDNNRKELTMEDIINIYRKVL